MISFSNIDPSFEELLKSLHNNSLYRSQLQHDNPATMIKDSPRIVEKRETKLSKWLSVIERDIIFPGEIEKETYYSVRPYDYVSILAVTDDQRIPLVQQYRPVLEMENLELPGGLIDANKSPEETALAELHEEAGLVASSVKSLGILRPDPGRLENRFHCFFSSNVEFDPSIVLEKRINLVWTNFDELGKMLLDGRFNSSLQIALLALASLKGYTRNLHI